MAGSSVLISGCSGMIVLYTYVSMSSADDLLDAIEASIRSVDFSLNVASKVYPPNHRADMARSQLETAREVLVKARDFCATRSTGSFPVPKKP